MKIMNESNRKRRIQKKAQIKMAENIAVLVLFIFLVVIGLVFYTGYKKVKLEDKKAESKIEHAIEIASRVNYLPELQCSASAIQRQGCVDLFKLRAVVAGGNGQSLFTMPQNKNQVYFGILGYSTIRLRQIYPPGDIDITLYEFLPQERGSEEFVPVPILIYDPASDNSVFGVLEVTVYG